MTRSTLGEKLFGSNDNRGVSPVIGVILMVAITVILAATIGTMVMSMTDNVDDAAPQASLSADENPDTSTITLTHEGGDVLDPSELTATTSGSGAVEISNTDTVGVGSTLTIDVTTDVAQGDEIRLIWDDEQVIFKMTLKNDIAAPTA